MGFSTDDTRIRNSFSIATERGPVPTHSRRVRPRPMFIRTPWTSRMENAAGQVMTIRGESLGGGKCRIARINGVEVDFTGEYSTVIVVQQDKPGVVATSPKVLSDKGVNIAFMRLFRESKGNTAYTIVESDGHFPRALRNRSKQSQRPRRHDHRTVGEESRLWISKTHRAACTLHAQQPPSPRSCAAASASWAKPRVMRSRTVRRGARNHALIRADTAQTPVKSMGGRPDWRQGKKLAQHAAKGRSICDVLHKAAQYAMAVLEVNASMGLIVAAPTAAAPVFCRACCLPCRTATTSRMNG